jgi:hypothetical protein
LNPQNAIGELDLSSRREIMTLACKPRLLSLHKDIGLKRGLTFVANPALPAYAPLLSFETTVKIVATASISIGCAGNISMTPLKVCRLTAFVTINWKNLLPRYSRGLLHASILGTD